MNSSSSHAVRKNPLLLRSFSISLELLPQIEEILTNCKKLVHLKIGLIQHDLNDGGKIWDGTSSINDELHSNQREVNVSDDEELSADEDGFELDVKLIASNLHELKRLHVGSELQLSRQPVAPPKLDQLQQLETLSLCCIGHRTECDNSRDEWNLRVLAQSSKVLTSLDLRGCYLKILSLGWLETERLESLHLYYQVPAASVLDKWARTLRYLTLARVSTRFKCHRSMGPEKPGEELDACLNCLAMSGEKSKLEQLDLQESDCTLGPLRLLVTRCKNLAFLDTRGCTKLPNELRDRYIDSTDILENFT